MSETLYAIGDIHGCLSKLIALLGVIRNDHLNHKTTGSDSRPNVVFLGDYIDRGPDSKGVLDFLSSPQLTRLYHPVFLRGNHEQSVIDMVHEMQVKGLPSTIGVYDFLRNGGVETMRSYGFSREKLNEKDVVRFINIFPTNHLEFLHKMEFSFETPNHLFCHAGVNPDYPLNLQNKENFIGVGYKRKAFLTSKTDFGKIVVHGHTPTSLHNVEVLSNRINVDTGAGHHIGFLSAVALREDGSVSVFKV